MNKRLRYLIFLVFVIAGLPNSAAASPLSFRPKMIAVNTSSNWSGYVAGAGRFTAVSGSWTVPNVRNNKSIKTDAAWVGIGGVTSHDLIQAGTEGITGLGGKVSYRAWYELLPNYSIPFALTIKAGDLVSVEISQQTKNQWLIKLTDRTTGKSVKKKVKYSSSLSSAEWIEEMPSSSTGLLALDNFKVVQFNDAHAVVNGKNSELSSLNVQPIALANNAGKILVNPSDIDATGSGFSVTRLH